MILVRKKFKFFLYMYLVKIRLKTESSAFHRLTLSSIKTAHSVCFTFIISKSLYTSETWDLKATKMAPKMFLFLNFTVISPFVLNFNTVAESVNHLVAYSSSFSSFT